LTYCNGPAGNVHDARLAIVSHAGEILTLRDQRMPEWPDVGVGTLLSAGSKLVLAGTNSNNTYPAVAVYEMLENDTRR